MSVLKFVTPLWGESEVHELRAFGKKAYEKQCGYFDDPATFAKWAEAKSKAGWNVYWTPNPVDPSLLGRAKNKLVDMVKGKGTTDKDIISQNWLLIDLDPVRPSGISSTDREHQAAQSLGDRIEDWMRIQGWTKPTRASSGNGHHMMYRLGSRTRGNYSRAERIKTSLEALACHFDTEDVKVDLTVFSPAQLWRVYGTMTRKGDDISERPHRMSRPMQQYDGIASGKLLQSLASLVPEARGRVSKAETQDNFATWVEINWPDTIPARWKDAGDRWVFPVCPFDDAHVDGSAYLIRFDTGHKVAGCLHGNCPGAARSETGRSLGWNKLKKLASARPYASIAQQQASSRGSAQIQLIASSQSNPQLTDLGNMYRLKGYFGDKVKFIEERGMDSGGWSWYSEGCWRANSGAQVRQSSSILSTLLFAEATAMDQMDTTHAEQIRKYAARSESASQIRNALQLFSAEVATKISDFDVQPHLLNVKNGVVDLRTGKLEKHSKELLMSKQTPFAYYPEATTPKWDAFLKQILPDKTLRDYVQRYLGYSFTGETSEQIIVFFTGKGGNGKSVLVEAVAAIMGDYGDPAPPNLLTTNTPFSDHIALVDLVGRRFIYSLEVDKGKHVNEAVVKTLTGGDSIKARYHHRSFFSFRPQATYLVAANHHPIIKGNDDGIWRRVRVVPFNVRIPDESQNKNLMSELLTEEAEGILKWLVDGAVAWYNEGMPESNAVQAASRDYRQTMDMLEDFFGECCTRNKRYQVAKIDLYNTYKQWARPRGMRPMNMRLFNTMLRERGYKEKVGRVPGHTRTVRIWEGIGIIVLPEPVATDTFEWAEA
jgi:P4 family phage/plasmid primase-like protien